MRELGDPELDIIWLVWRGLSVVQHWEPVVMYCNV